MAQSHNLQKSLADSGVHINTHPQTEPAAGGRTSDTTQMKTSLTELTTTECEAAAAKISCALKLQWNTAQNLRDETCNRPSFPLALEEVRQADGRTRVTHPCPSASCTLAYDRSAAQTCTSTKIPQTSLLPFANFRSRRTTPEHRAAEKLLANNLQSLAGYGSANFVSSLPSLAPCSCTCRC